VWVWVSIICLSVQIEGCGQVGKVLDKGCGAEVEPSDDTAALRGLKVSYRIVSSPPVQPPRTSGNGSATDVPAFALGRRSNH
jgi:hypothetical protein